MRLSQRQGTVITMSLLIAGILITILALLSFAPIELLLPICSVAVAYSLILFGYLRGWPLMPQLLVILVTVVTGLTTELNTGFNVQILLPAAIALVMTRPLWIVGSGLATWALILARSGGQGSYADLSASTFFLTIIVIMLIARVVTETAQRAAEANAQRAEEERAATLSQAQQLADANQLQDEQLARQSALLELVATLETPTIRMADNVLFASIVGHLDSRRAEQLTTRLLQDVYDQHAAMVILDIAGVSVVDTGVALALTQTAQALRLLGCAVCISGISAAVATTLVQLGVQFDGIETVQTPQEALAHVAHLTHEGRISSTQQTFTNGAFGHNGR